MANPVFDPGTIMDLHDFDRTGKSHLVVLLKNQRGTIFYRDATQAEKLAFRLGMKQVYDETKETVPELPESAGEVLSEWKS